MNLPPPSCPYGYTREDLETILGDRLLDFNGWMVGQTCTLCNGTRYHYDRYHNQFCEIVYVNPVTHEVFPGHSEDSEFDWRCGYMGTGYYEDSACKDNPHGIVTYRCDLETYLAGREPLD
jgi:hypothetical protein